jgi:hypothetical protein
MEKADDDRRPGFDGWAWVDALLLLVEQGSLNATDHLVAMRLSRHATYSTGTDARPSEATLAHECNLSVRTVRRSLSVLRRVGIIQMDKRGGGTGPSARGSTYRMVGPTQDTSGRSSTQDTGGLSGGTQARTQARTQDTSGHQPGVPGVPEEPPSVAVVVEASGSSGDGFVDDNDPWRLP